MEKLFEQFKQYLLTEKMVAKNTYNAYVADLRQFLDFVINKPEKEGTISDLRCFLTMLKEQGLSPASLGRKIATLKAFYAYAHRYHGVENRAADLEMPKLTCRQPRGLSPHDIEILVTVAAHDHSAIGLRNQVIVQLLYYTGIRISELTQLHLSDLDFKEGMLLVADRSNKGRVLTLPPALMALLQNYCATLRHHTKGYLFPIVYGGKEQPISRQACWLVLKKLWKKTSIQREITPIMLRHTAVYGMHQQESAVSSLRAIYDKKHPRL